MAESDSSLRPAAFVPARLPTVAAVDPQRRAMWYTVLEDNGALSHKEM